MTGLKKKRPTTESRTLRGSGRAGLVKGKLRVDLFFWLMLALAFIPQIARGQDSAGEYELKAAMLYNLTRFVEWPAVAYADAQAPTVLCILGRDPFGDSLTAMASSPSAGGRSVQIRRIANSKEVRGCHVAYISSSERKNIAPILATVKGTSVLTVGEMAQFAARGGMIQFSLEEKQVRFEVNLEAAAESDLKISSRLLVLARVVKDPNKNPAREALHFGSRRLKLRQRRSRKSGAKCGSKKHVFPAIRTMRGEEADEIAGIPS